MSGAPLLPRLPAGNGNQTTPPSTSSVRTTTTRQHAEQVNRGPGLNHCCFFSQYHLHRFRPRSAFECWQAYSLRLVDSGNIPAATAAESDSACSHSGPPAARCSASTNPIPILRGALVRLFTEYIYSQNTISITFFFSSVDTECKHGGVSSSPPASCLFRIASNERHTQRESLP